MPDIHWKVLVKMAIGKLLHKNKYPGTSEQQIWKKSVKELIFNIINGFQVTT